MSLHKERTRKLFVAFSRRTSLWFECEVHPHPALQTHVSNFNLHMVVLSGESVPSLGCRAQLEEMGPWGMAFESYSLDLLSDPSLIPLWRCEQEASLCFHHRCEWVLLLCPPWHDSLYPQTMIWNESFLLCIDFITNFITVASKVNDIFTWVGLMTELFPRCPTSCCYYSGDYVSILRGPNTHMIAMGVRE